MRNPVLVTDTIRNSKNSCSKKEIQQLTSIAWGTMCKVVDTLVANGYLYTRKDTSPKTRGRPMIPICINAQSAYFMGFDIGASRTRVVVCDLNFNVVFRQEFATPYYKNSDSFFNWVFEAFDKVVDSGAFEREKLKGITLAVSGNVDPENGIIVSGGNWGVKWGTNLPVVEKLSAYANVPVSALSAPTAGVWAEYQFGRWHGCGNLITVGLGVGIGAGIVSNNRLLVSHPKCQVGYIGHMLIPGNDHICTCGFRGCLESYSGGGYLTNVAKEIVPNRPELYSAEALDKAAEAGDKDAVAIMSKAASYNAVGIASMIQLYSPDALIFSGGQCKKDGFLFNQTLTELKNILPPERLSRFEIGLTSLENYQSALGAARIAYEKFF